MANRDLNFDPTVTRVVPEEPAGADMAATAGDIAAQAAQISANGKALQATATTQSAFRKLDSDFRLQNADNPNDPAAIQKLQDARQKVVQSQSANVPSIALRDYTNKAIELGTQSDDLNQAWATQQQISNGVNSLQTGRITYLNQANQAGQQFAQDPTADIGTALDYNTALKSMHQFADPVLGSNKTGAFLKEFNSDYVKSFIAGVAQRSPQRAAAMLNDPAIAQHFSTQDIGDMAQVIQKTTKQQALIQSLQTVKAQVSLTDIVNDPAKTYFEKRALIDKADMDGSTTPKAAAAARRVLTSSSDLDAQTDTPIMSDIISKVYGLNANAATNPDDYLTGVQNIQQEVLDMQASNKLTAKDAKKLNDQISNLTNAKLASATNSAGNEFYDANQMFDTLPPEYRPQATRSLFYASHGQNMSQQQLKNQAQQVIDNINKTRRVRAMNTLQGVQQSDTSFLESIGVTSDKVSYTAQKYGISQQEVITQLRAAQAAKGRGKPAGKASFAAPEDTGGDISTKAPEPAGIVLPGTEDEDTTP